MRRLCHNCRGHPPNTEQKKTLVKSEGWLAPPESLEFAPADELKSSSSVIRGVNRWRTDWWSELRCPLAVSQTAPGRLRTLPLRHYGRGARSSLEGVWSSASCCKCSQAQPEAEKCRDGAPKGEGARKRMPAVTRTIRGARHTGRGLGCAHPKCRCGFYRLRRSALRLPLFLEATVSCSGLARLGRKKRVARMGLLTLPCRGRVAPKGRGVVCAASRQIETDEKALRPSPPPAALRAATSPLQGEVKKEACVPRAAAGCKTARHGLSLRPTPIGALHGE